MIKMTDFRVGNWIADYEVDPNKTTYFQVEEIKKFNNKKLNNSLGVEYRNGSVWNGDDESLAIKLTEEWLLKFGFTTFIIDVWDSPEAHKNNYHIVKHGEKWIFRGLGASIVEVKHIHQLQNLYFSVTGEELEVKS